MTALVRPPTTATNGNRRPVRIEVDRHELVGRVMDWEALTFEALDANGATMLLLSHLSRDGVVYEAIAATQDTHERLFRLLNELKAIARELDGSPVPYSRRTRGR
jgi:hypothetical protein